MYMYGVRIAAGPRVMLTISAAVVFDRFKWSLNLRQPSFDRVDMLRFVACVKFALVKLTTACCWMILLLAVPCLCVCLAGRRPGNDVLSEFDQ